MRSTTQNVHAKEDTNPVYDSHESRLYAAGNKNEIRVQVSTAALTNNRTSRTADVYTNVLLYLDDETEVPEEVRSRKDDPRRERPIAEVNRCYSMSIPNRHRGPHRCVEYKTPYQGTYSQVWTWEQQILTTHIEAERSKLPFLG